MDVPSETLFFFFFFFSLSLPRRSSSSGRATAIDAPREKECINHVECRGAPKSEVDRDGQVRRRRRLYSARAELNSHHELIRPPTPLAIVAPDDGVRVSSTFHPFRPTMYNCMSLSPAVQGPSLPVAVVSSSPSSSMGRPLKLKSS